jgi:hypothetical protein
MDETGRALSKWIYLGTTAVTAVVCVTATLLGYPRVAWGFLAGSATGALLMGGLLLAVFVLMAPQGGASGAFKLGAAALQVIKYLVVLAVLYVLIVKVRVDPAGLAAGILAPIVVCAAVVLLKPDLYRKAPPDQPDKHPGES